MLFCNWSSSRWSSRRRLEWPARSVALWLFAKRDDAVPCWLLWIVIKHRLSNNLLLLRFSFLFASGGCRDWLPVYWQIDHLNWPMWSSRSGIDGFVKSLLADWQRPGSGEACLDFERRRKGRVPVAGDTAGPNYTWPRWRMAVYWPNYANWSIEDGAAATVDSLFTSDGRVM